MNEPSDLSLHASIVIAVAAALGFTGCGGTTNSPPVAHPLSLSTDEDTEIHGLLVASDPDHDPIAYSITIPPSHGIASVNSATGALVYTPNPDYFGLDSFSVTVQAKGGQASAQVSVDILSVQDSPRVQAIADITNSAYTLTSDVAFSAVDPDGDTLAFEIDVQDAEVADAEVPPESTSIRLTPKTRGNTTVTLTASDGQRTTSTHFQFTVGDVTKAVVIESRSAQLTTGIDANTSTNNTHLELVSLQNTLPRSVSFTLTYNGNKAFTSAADAADHIRTMPEQFAGEPFERKLWRYVRDNTYHEVPINRSLSWHSYWPTLNSLGFGLCSHAAAVFTEVARAAGYEARIWGLSGHVVPEIRVNGRWQMYDPDLAIYYFTRDGRVAGVEELANDPSLIISPTNPIYAAIGSGSYDTSIATIYDANSADNFIGDSDFLWTGPTGDSGIELPGGAQLLLPGHWTDAPTGYDGNTPSTVKAYKQAAIELPAGWTGAIHLPWILWDVQGSGTITVAERTFSAGSSALRTFLDVQWLPLPTAHVSENPSGLRLVFLVNAMWYELEEANDIQITGQDVWAIHISSHPVDSALEAGRFPDSLRRPRI